MINSLKFTVFLIVWLLLIPAQSRSQDPIKKTEEAPKTSFIVYFEKQNIQENDSLWVEALLSNESDFKLTNVTIDINSPKFLHWYDASSDKRLTNNSLNLGSIDPHSNLKRKFYLKSNSNIIVGDFNVMFIFRHDWKVTDPNRSTRRSITINEKPLKINLFGSESVAGIPLALAGFIVPGLVFWLIVRLFKVPWGVDLALGDKMIYSVLISITVLSICTYIGSFSQTDNWNKNFDVRNGIGIEKLAWLAFAGAIVGLVVGVGTRVVMFLWNQWQQAKAKELIISPYEAAHDHITLLEKMLRLNPYRNPVTVTVSFNDGTQYIGYHYAQMADATVLVGSFRLKLRKFPDSIKTKLQKYCEDKQHHLTNNELVKILRLTRQAVNSDNELQVKDLIEVETAIREQPMSGGEKMREEYIRWQSSDVSVRIEQTQRSRELLQLD
jgi:hypothetical protein